MRRFSRYLPALALLWLLAASLPAHAQTPSWFTTGPYGGWITGLDYAQGQPDTMLAASLGGGIWKTTNGGTSWTAVNTGLADPDAKVHSVALSPTFTSDGTALAGAHNGGIHRSTNGGQTWSKVYPTSGAKMEVHSLAFAPNFASSRVALAAAANYAGGLDAGIFRSGDGGATWSERLDGNAQELSCWFVAFSPNFANDSTAFAACDGGRLYRSTNGGMNWHLRNSGLPTDSKDAVREIAISPNFANDGTIFVGTHRNGVWKTTNGGASWSRLYTLGSWEMRYVAVAPDFDGADGNPGDDVVFAGGPPVGLWRSNDGGSTWTELSYPLIDGVSAIRKDTYVIRPMPGFSANNSNQQPLFVATHGAGVLYHPRGGVGNGWEVRNSGLAAQEAFVVHVADDGTVFAGANGGGLFRSDDGGATWLSRNGIAGATTAAGSIATAPNFAAVPHMVAGSYWNGGIAYSLNRGQSWTQATSSPPNQVRALAYAPTYPAENLILAGTGGGWPADVNGIWRSTDGGANWTQLDNQLKGKYVISLAAAPTGGQDWVVFAGIFGDGLWKSTNRGTSWTQVAPALAGKRAWAVAVSPNYASDQTVFVATEDAGLWRIRGGGSIQEQVGWGFYRGLALSPSYTTDQTVYVADARGDVWRSTNGGSSFTGMGDTASFERPTRRGLAAGRGQGAAVFEAFEGMSVWQYGTAPPVCEPIAEDFDGNGTVDLQDVTAVAQRWPAGSSDPAYEARFDLGGTAGAIDVVDISIVAAAWGSYCP